MLEPIQRNFDVNLERVNALVSVYQDLANGQGRRRVAQTDVLRAAVVLCHATLEDLLRSVLAWRWPQAAPEQLAELAFAGGTATKITVSQLAAHRGKSVDQVVQESVSDALEKSNFNNLGELKSALRRSHLPEHLADSTQDKLQSMMSRRHMIVHRADQNDLMGRGQHPARSLSQEAVQAWVDAVEAFGSRVLDELRREAA